MSISLGYSKFRIPNIFFVFVVSSTHGTECIQNINVVICLIQVNLRAYAKHVNKIVTEVDVRIKRTAYYKIL